MKASRARALRYLVGVALTMGIIEACSGDDASSPIVFNEPASLKINSISLDKGDALDGGSTELACDYKIGVELEVDDVYLRPPGTCQISQCGRVLLELLDSSSSKPWIKQEYASAGITLDLSQFAAPNAARPLVAGTYTLSVELIDDAGNPYNTGDGGKGSAERSFELALPSQCGSAGGGSSGMGGAAGEAGSSGEGGAAGSSGEAGSSGSAGDPGHTTAGSSGSAGSSGTAGSGGSGGGSGSSGAAGLVGVAGA